MIALEALHEELGEELFNSRVLLIHAGGYSQRQPNASVMGKMFSLLPRETDIHSKHPYTIFDLKLELYLPFLSRMNPGVFLAASDALEAFTIDNTTSNIQSQWHFRSEGFTVLAHPSSLKIGRNHGVYVLDKGGIPKSNDSESVYLCPCLQVLQKPSIEEMHEAGAVVKSDQSETVYTDSAFYFSTSVVKALLAFYANEKPIRYELDAYGDFLQPLGPKATPDYVTNTSRVVCSEGKEELVDLRRRLFDCLRGFRIQALVLERSKFYHVGTFPELLHNLCEDPEFQTAFRLKTPKENGTVKGIVMHSKIHPQSIVPRKSIIEYCDFGDKFDILDGCILSGCSYDRSFSISQSVFMCTVPVLDSGTVHYVTAVYGTFDDMKRKAAPSSLSYLGSSTLDKVFKVLEMKKVDMTSLWDAPLFPLEPSPSDSFDAALQMLSVIASDNAINSDLKKKRVSFSDIMRTKDIRTILARRDDLLNKIVDEQ